MSADHQTAAAEHDILFLKDIATGEMIPIGDMEPPTELWAAAVPPPPPPPPHRVSMDPKVVVPLDNDLKEVGIADLKHGDVVFVSEFSLVSVGQLFVRLITGDVFSSGGSDAVHCFIVIDSDRTHAGVAHVTNSGACINLISQMPTASQMKTGRVYRLLADPDGIVGIAAAREASGLVEAQIPFGTTKSLISAFRDSKAGDFIHKRFASKRASLEMFCTEFVMTTIQSAIVKQGRLDDKSLIRATDIDGSACTPMQLEAFFRDNAMTYGDWQELGVCSFHYS